MTYYAPMSYDIDDLRDLGINYSYQAAEFERELDVRFSEFTPLQREIWRRQTLCLTQYARTRTYSSATRSAGVTVYTMEAWERDNVLGFSRRKEIADREFCDGLEELLFERARMPDSPPSLLSAVLRAQMPEKYGSSRHDRDQDDERDNFANGPDTYHKLLADIIQALQEREDSADADELSPASPNDESASDDPKNPTAENEETGSDVAAPETLDLSLEDQALTGASLTPVPGTSPTKEETRSEDISTPRNPAPSTQNPNDLNRRQRRQLRRQANRRKSHLARAPN